MHPFLQATLGGVLLGLGAVALLLLNGRIAGISGILGGVLTPRRGEFGWRLAFLVGLVAGPLLYGLTAGPAVVRLDAPLWAVIGGGFLVGAGTLTARGCTSGHGLMGLARLSPRSFVAVATFMAVAIATVFAVRHLGA